jgi:hypothetical protein
MKRLTAWLTGVAGGMAAYRAFKRAPRPVPAAEPDPAVALREKLAEAKAVEPEPPAADEPADPDARRRAVHERGRAAVDEMRRSDPE